MTNEEKLLRAMGEIDDELIKEASVSYKKKPSYITHGLTVAASIVFVSAIILAASKFLPKSFDKAAVGGDYPFLNDGATSENGAPPPNSDMGDSTLGSNGGANFSPPLDNDNANDTDSDNGEKIDCEYGYIYNIEKIGKYSIQFDLKLSSNVPEKMDFVIYGYNSIGETDAICSSGDISDEYSLVLSPEITVNGLKAEELPTTPGEYNIIIDYSAIEGTEYTWSDDIKITYFGIINR